MQKIILGTTESNNQVINSYPTYSKEEIKTNLKGKKEISAIIKDIKVDINQITLICDTISYWDENYQGYNFKGNIIVKPTTTILSETQNQLQQLQTFKGRQDTIYVTLDENEILNGNLVATNIEVMGC